MKKLKCAKCERVLPETEFHKNPSRATGHKAYCKECCNQKAREHWQAHPKYRGGKIMKNAKHVRSNKIRAVEYMGGECGICGEAYPACVFDFHHIEPDKKEIKLARLLKFSWAKVMTELDKCIMLCANCHRLVHESPNPDTDQELIGYDE